MQIPEPVADLLAFANRLRETPVSEDAVRLHIADTVAAFLVGVRTEEGTAFAQFYARRRNTADRAAGAAAIARLSECDDIHLASCVTPGSVIVPLALGMGRHCRIQDVNRAVAAGYAAGLSFGIAMNGIEALSRGVWPTLLAAPLITAVTASVLCGHDAETIAHAMALALAGIGGIAGRPKGEPSGRWFTLSEAIVKGVRASEAAAHGVHGDLTLLSEGWLVEQVGHRGVDVTAFNAPSSLSEVGFKPFPIARQALSAVLAFQALLAKGLDPRDIAKLEVRIPSAHWPMLTRKVDETDRLSRLSNLGLQLAFTALDPERLFDAERGADPRLIEFGNRAVVQSVEWKKEGWPKRWPASIAVSTNGTRYEKTVIGTAYDSDAPELPKRLSEKWLRLLSPKDAREILDNCSSPAADAHGALWQMIERRVSMTVGGKPAE